MVFLRKPFLATLLALLWSGFAWGQQLVVFGDSLSDGGNAALAVLGTGGQFEEIPFLPPPFGDDLDRIPAAPYNLDPANPFAARFSDGPVWAEQLSARWGIPLLPSLAGGSNYAFGGANTGPLPGVPPDVVPTLRQQADQYLAGLNPAVGIPDGTIHVVFGGGNDIRRILGNPDNKAVLGVLNASSDNISGIVGDLAGAGARTILVVLVPNVGLAPDVNQGGFGRQGATASLALNLLVIKKLKPHLARRGLRLLIMDTFGLVSLAARHPERFGLSEGVLPCLDFGTICSSPEKYLFWDGIHPTSAGHGLVADRAERILAH